MAAIRDPGKIPNLGEVAAYLHDYHGEPNELVARIHPRIPVILPEKHHAA
jgi:hypothetical protein